MSSMLEEAIIDAEALKAAALKSAETQVLEKYQREVGLHVADLLEQGEEEEELGGEEEAGDDMGMDMGMDLGGDMGMDMGGEGDSHEELAGAIAAQLPPAALGIDVVPTDVPTPADPDDSDATPEEKEVVIDLDALIAQAEDEAAGEEEAEVGLGIEPPLDDEFGLGGDEEEEPLFEDGEFLLEEDEIFVTDEDLSGLIEELTVDYNPVASGALGSNQAEEADAEEAAIAAERDTEVEEERKEQEKALKDLEENVKKTRAELKQANKFKKHAEQKYEKIQSLALQMKEQLESTLVSNARLFYINEVLKNNRLNAKQKQQLTESLSEAESVDHAKMIYETLKKTLDNGSFKKNRGNTLNEVVSRPSGLLPRRAHKKGNKETDFAERMKKLAGIN